MMKLFLISKFRQSYGYLLAWGEITLSTIVNCWCKAGILPAEWCRLLRPDRAAVAVAEATEGAQLTANYYSYPEAASGKWDNPHECN